MPRKLDDMSYDEKMYTLFGARGVDDSVSVKDKIRYTQNYLHSMRMGNSSYSPETEAYLENYLAELQGTKKKEPAAKAAAKKDTGSTVKAPHTASVTPPQSLFEAPIRQSTDRNSGDIRRLFDTGTIIA